MVFSIDRLGSRESRGIAMCHCVPTLYMRRRIGSCEINIYHAGETVHLESLGFYVWKTFHHRQGGQFNIGGR